MPGHLLGHKTCPPRPWVCPVFPFLCFFLSAMQSPRQGTLYCKEVPETESSRKESLKEGSSFTLPGNSWSSGTLLPWWRREKRHGQCHESWFGAQGWCPLPTGQYANSDVRAGGTGKQHIRVQEPKPGEMKRASGVCGKPQSACFSAGQPILMQLHWLLPRGNAGPAWPDLPTFQEKPELVPDFYEKFDFFQMLAASLKMWALQNKQNTSADQIWLVGWRLRTSGQPSEWESHASRGCQRQKRQGFLPQAMAAQV